MDIRPIRTEEDYKAALREVSAYFDNDRPPAPLMVTALKFC